MKKLLTFFLCLCFMSPITLIFCGCGVVKPTQKVLTITNFSNYVSLSVGFANQSRAANYSSQNVKIKAQLLGKNQNGIYEQIQFKEDSEFTSVYNISAIEKLGSFIFINYCKDYSGQIYTTFNNTPQDYGFVIDSKSGKMFDITEEDINIFTQGCYCTYEDSFYTTKNDKLYKYSIEDEKLKSELIIDLNKVPSFGSPFMVDKYGNIFSGTDIVKTHYVYTTKGALVKLDCDVKMGMNNIVYTNNNQWFNSEGVIEDADFIPSDFTNISIEYQDDYFLYNKDNTYYYRQYDKENNGEIIKYEKLNDIEYNVEIIQMEKYEGDKDKGVIVNDRIYFLNSEEVYYIDIKNGYYHAINSDYIFNKIYTDNQGHVIFEGVDQYLNDIVGEIHNDDTVTIGLTPREFEIYFILPIN